MYVRREVCLLTGIQPERFKTLVGRQQLPFLGAAPKEAAAEDASELAGGAGWNRYTSLDVLAFALADRLMAQVGYADGLLPSTATAIVENALGGIDDPLAADEGADLWIGYVGEIIAGEPTHGGRNAAGTLAQIAETVSRAGDAALRPARLFVVNVSQVLRDIKARASRKRVPFPRD